MFNMAIEYAAKHEVPMVHAAGNDGENIDSVANFQAYCYRWFIKSIFYNRWCIGMREPELAASFSNYGISTVDLFAPGVDIYSTMPNQNMSQVMEPVWLHLWYLEYSLF